MERRSAEAETSRTRVLSPSAKSPASGELPRPCLSVVSGYCLSTGRSSIKAIVPA